MIATIIIVGFALAWLEWETDGFTVRLPVGGKPVDKSVPYWWQPNKDNLMLCRGCRRRHCDKERWLGWKLPARTIKAWGSTMNFSEGCNIGRANLLKQTAREYNRKHSVPSGHSPLPLFITQVRVGSHKEWVETDDKGHGYHRIVEEYDTRYKDSLVSIKWLKIHEHDEYPEPVLDILVDGELKTSINGNYKKGVIANVLKPYTTKVRTGCKVAVLNVGEDDKVS